MASVASVGTSPLSGYESHPADSASDEPDENLWHMINGMSGSSSSSGAGLSFSPASGSLSSWAMVGGHGHGHPVQPSPTDAHSPLNLDFDQPASLPTSAYGETTGPAFGVIPAPTSAPTSGQFMGHARSHDGQHLFAPGDVFGEHALDSNIGEADISF